MSTFVNPAWTLALALGYEVDTSREPDEQFDLQTLANEIVHERDRLEKLAYSLERRCEQAVKVLDGPPTRTTIRSPFDGQENQVVVDGLPEWAYTLPPALPTEQVLSSEKDK